MSQEPFLKRVAPPPLAHQSAPPEYEKYLRRKLWKTIKGRIFNRDSGICFRCGGSAAVVHHRSYAPEVLEGNADGYLVSLCDGCHTIVHKDDLGRWRSWGDAETVLFEPDHRTEFPEPVITSRSWIDSLPGDWARMTSVQRHGWLSRRAELVSAQPKRRKSGPTTSWYPSREEAEVEAFKIIDRNPKLTGRYRGCWEHMYLAMMSQGHEFFGNAHSFRSGLKAKIAKQRFESFADHLTTDNRYAPISDQARSDLESEAIWNRPKADRRRKSFGGEA